MPWSLSGVRPTAARVARPLQWSDSLGLAGIEVPRLARYLVIAGVIGGFALLNAWSRIDLRETSLALGATEKALEEARAEHSRLQLELAALRDPARLAAASTSLTLVGDVRVVDVDPPTPTP